MEYPETPRPEEPRPFLEHLDELRSRLLKSVVAVLAAASACYPATERVIKSMSDTAGGLIFLRPTEAIFTKIKMAVALGILLALPIVLFQAWRFTASALAPSSRRTVLWSVPVSYLLFLAGCAAGFFVLVPVGAGYLLAVGGDAMTPMISAEAYLDFTLAMCLTLGLVAQLPVASFFLSRIGILDPAQLAENRRYAVVGAYILSALATPGPDPVTALMLFGPSYLLFEASILTARLARRAATGASPTAP